MIQFYLYEVLSIVKVTDTESEMVVARCGCVGRGEVGNAGLMDTVFALGVENILELDRGGGLHNNVNVVNITELFTLK